MCQPLPRREPPPASRPRGMTLIEVMVIIATLGLLIAIGVTTWQRVTDQAPPHNAANDMVEAMQRARARAIETRSDVWMVVYPGFNKRANTVTAGRGAWFVLEDAGAASSLDYRQFDPVTGNLSGPNARLIESTYLENYGGRVRYRLPRSRIEMGQADAPFAGLEITTSCTFCTTGSRGAIVFAADGSIRFFDGSGDRVEGDPKGQALILISDRSKYTSVVAVSPTTFGAFRK